MSEQVFALMFQGGEIDQEVTSITLVNNTEKIVDWACPTTKRRILLSVRVLNPDDVGRTVTLLKYKEAAKTNLIKTMMSQAVAASASAQWPLGLAIVSAQRRGTMPAEFFGPGNTMQIRWPAGGASAGGTDADGLVIEYLEIDEP